jgi:acetyl-CoA acyltransferase
MSAAVIVDAVRTPLAKGKPGGAYADIHPVDLHAAALRALVERTGIDPVVIDDVISGAVGQVGEQSGNTARWALLAAGYPESVPGVTVDRQCGSSQQALHFAAQGVIAGAYDVVIACGVESMSRVPMGVAPAGGDAFAPLAARYPSGLAHQGIGAELLAARWGFTRDDLDAFSARSHERAAVAGRTGQFDRELVPITRPDGTVHLDDETVRATTTVEGLAALGSAFEDATFAERFPEVGWVITPGNSSPLTDGASAVLVMSEKRASALGLTPRARFHTFAVTGSDPLVMLDGVIPATEQALKRSGLGIDDIDSFEVNEAFAPVPLAWARHFDVDHDRLNARGGAIALGHPLGASGTRLLTTMLGHLEATDGRYGLQTMCEGGGMANATIIERLA